MEIAQVLSERIYGAGIGPVDGGIQAGQPEDVRKRPGGAIAEEVVGVSAFHAQVEAVVMSDFEEHDLYQHLGFWTIQIRDDLADVLTGFVICYDDQFARFRVDRNHGFPDGAIIVVGAARAAGASSSPAASSSSPSETAAAAAESPSPDPASSTGALALRGDLNGGA